MIKKSNDNPIFLKIQTMGGSKIYNILNFQLYSLNNSFRSLKNIIFIKNGIIV